MTFKEANKLDIGETVIIKGVKTPAIVKEVEHYSGYGEYQAVSVTVQFLDGHTGKYCHKWLKRPETGGKR